MYLSNEVFTTFAFTLPTLGILSAEVPSGGAAVWGVLALTPSTPSCQ